MDHNSPHMQAKLGKPALEAIIDLRHQAPCSRLACGGPHFDSLAQVNRHVSAPNEQLSRAVLHYLNPLVR